MCRIIIQVIESSPGPQGQGNQDNHVNNPAVCCAVTNEISCSVILKVTIYFQPLCYEKFIIPGPKSWACCLLVLAPHRSQGILGIHLRNECNCI